MGPISHPGIAPSMPTHSALSMLNLHQEFGARSFAALDTVLCCTAVFVLMLGLHLDHPSVVSIHLAFLPLLVANTCGGMWMFSETTRTSLLVGRNTARHYKTLVGKNADVPMGGVSSDDRNWMHALTLLVIGKLRARCEQR